MPDKVVNMANVLLMGFGCKDSLEEPPPVMNLVDVPNFLKGGNGLAHDWNFFWAVLYLLNHNRKNVAGINNTFVVFDQDEYLTIIKNCPILPYQCINAVTEHLLQVQEVKVLAEKVPLNRLVVLEQEKQINNVKRRRRMFELAEDGTAMDIVKESVEFVGLIRKTPVVNEDIFNPTTTLVLVSNVDGHAGRFLRGIRLCCNRAG
jgi:hypothetical protein